MLFHCDKTVQIKRKKKSFQRVLEIVVPAGRVGPALPACHWHPPGWERGAMADGLAMKTKESLI